MVAALIALQYAGRFTSSSSQDQSSPLYSWTFFAGALGQELVFLAVTIALGGLSWRLYALRRPVSVRRAAWAALAIFVVINVFEWAWTAVVHPGNEQGLTPATWQPAHAAAYVANGVVISTLVPVVEELVFRGVGFGLLERFGQTAAIVITGVAFGLSHGLVLELPVVALFGCLLGVLRARTRSTVPCIVLHAAFNLFALVGAVTWGG